MKALDPLGEVRAFGVIPGTPALSVSPAPSLQRELSLLAPSPAASD